MDIPTKEIEKVNTQVTGFQSVANSLVIKSPEDMSAAADILNDIKNAEKTIGNRKEEITRPLMSGLASVRTLFKPLEIGLDNAKKVVKAKVLAYQELEQKRIDEEAAKIEARVEKGTMRADTGAKKLANIDEATTTAKGVGGGKITTRKITKVRIIDETAIPREYLVPDMKKITADVLEGVSVPGAEKYTENIIAA